MQKEPDRRSLNNTEPGLFLMERPGFFDYTHHVFSVQLNPALVQAISPKITSLLDRSRAGDAEAFGEICRAYETRLLRQAVALCANAALAEDLAQDTLVEAWKCLRRYNGRCQLFTWLCAILLNRYRNTIREKRAIPFSSLAAEKRDTFQENLVRAADQESPPDQAAVRREQAEALRRCIDCLPPKHQQVIHLRFYVDDSLEGIAAALGCSVGTVKSRLFHALEKLRGMEAMSDQLVDAKFKVESL
jgi:RNA polymerase sigma-70 factor (ECF subfamily)